MCQIQSETSPFNGICGEFEASLCKVDPIVRQLAVETKELFSVLFIAIEKRHAGNEQEEKKSFSGI